MGLRPYLQQFVSCRSPAFSAMASECLAMCLSSRLCCEGEQCDSPELHGEVQRGCLAPQGLRCIKDRSPKPALIPAPLFSLVRLDPSQECPGGSCGAYEGLTIL